MSVNQRQFDQLTEMGIGLWQHKVANVYDNDSTQQNIRQEEAYISQDNLSLANLTKQTIFTDILHALDVSIGEVTASKDHLDLGLFNWYFTAKEHNEPAIHCAHNNLFSPSIMLIRQSSELKKQLWLTITENIL